MCADPKSHDGDELNVAATDRSLRVEQEQQSEHNAAKHDVEQDFISCAEDERIHSIQEEQEDDAAIADLEGSEIRIRDVAKEGDCRPFQ